jgi:hypothetical protein
MATEFAPDDHICVLYDTEEVQLTVAAPYVAEGLAKRRSELETLRAAPPITSGFTRFNWFSRFGRFVVQ